jgi:hypothetical protein
VIRTRPRVTRSCATAGRNPAERAVRERLSARGANGLQTVGSPRHVGGIRLPGSAAERSYRGATAEVSPAHAEEP